MTVPLDLMSLRGRMNGVLRDRGELLRGAMTQPPSVDLSIEVAGQIEFVVSDPHRRMCDEGGLLSDSAHGLLHSAPSMTYADAAYELAAMSKDDDDYTLSFEDRTAAWLRQYKSFIKAVRKASPTAPGVTAAEFIDRMVREPAKDGRVIRFRCPELHQFQPPLPPDDTDSGQDPNLEPGASDGTLKVKGHAATREQAGLMASVYRIAAKKKPPHLAMVALFAAGTTENEWTEGRGNGADVISLGFLQITDKTAASLGIDRGNITQEVDAFLDRGFTGAGGAIALAKAHPGWEPYAIAQAVQGSGAGRASNGAANYGKWQAEAVANLKALGAGAGDGLGDASVPEDYEFTRGQPGEPEDSWACSNRIADERNWRWFAVQNLATFASEPRMYAQKPRASISEYDNGVGAINYDWRPRIRVNTLRTTVHMEPNFLVPGQVIEVVDPGPVNGRWLISRVQQAGDSNVAQIEARKPQAPKREPSSSSAPGADLDSGSGSDLFAACKEISDKKYPYVWGGGHGAAGTPSGGTGRDSGTGYDCSGSCVAALAAVGYGYKVGGPVDASGAMASSWGQPGKGQEFTVWANSAHVFIEFHGEHAGYQFNTAGHPGDRGPRLLKQSYSSNGFTARHWEGH